MSRNPDEAWWEIEDLRMRAETLRAQGRAVEAEVADSEADEISYRDYSEPGW